MKKCVLKKYELFGFIFIILMILILVLCMNLCRENTREILKNDKKNFNTDGPISYIIYDNQDKENIKILVTFQTDDAIEYLVMPNR